MFCVHDWRKAKPVLPATASLHLDCSCPAVGPLKNNLLHLLFAAGGMIPGAAFRESCNQLQYGTTRPPAYDLSRVTAPTVYFLGGKDCELLALDPRGDMPQQPMLHMPGQQYPLVCIVL